MPQLTVGFGVALILTGVIAYFATGQESATALIPSIAGVPILIAGIVAMRPGWRMHGLYAAAVLAFILAVGTLRGVATLIGGDVTTGSVVNSVLFVVSIVFLIFCVQAVRAPQESEYAE